MTRCTHDRVVLQLTLPDIDGEVHEEFVCAACGKHVEPWKKQRRDPTRMRTDESNIGVWLWLTLIVIINVTWISMDLWLHKHGHELLTQEFQEGIQSRYGLLLAAAIGASVGAFVAHMYVS